MDYKRIQNVLQRLEKRATLLEVAKQLQKELPINLSNFLGEAEQVIFCNNPPPGISVDYDC